MKNISSKYWLWHFSLRYFAQLESRLSCGPKLLLFCMSCGENQIPRIHTTLYVQVWTSKSPYKYSTGLLVFRVWDMGTWLFLGLRILFIHNDPNGNIQWCSQFDLHSLLNFVTYALLNVPYLNLIVPMYPSPHTCSLILLQMFCQMFPMLFPHFLHVLHMCSLITFYISVACAIGPSVTTSSTDFSFQNLAFWNLFEFSAAEIISKSISPTFWVPSLTK